MNGFRVGKVYYGWWIALALAITTTLSYGILYYSFSVFIVPVHEEMGWSIAQITGAQSLALLVSTFAHIPVGIWLDKYGARWLMTGGSILAAVLVLGWSQVESLTAFYLIWFGMGFAMASVFYEPAFTVIANWFTQMRGRALALITFIAGFASTIFLPLADWLLQNQGWRGAILILAIIIGSITIPLHAFVLRRRPADLGLMPDGASREKVEKMKPAPSITWRVAVGNQTFWMLTIAFGLAGIANMGVRVHFIPLLIDRQYDPSFAAWVTGLIGAMQVVGRVIFAPLETRFSPRAIATTIFSLQVAAMFVLALADSTAAIVLFVVLFGATYGAMTLVRPLLLADLYGSAQYGRISSIMAFVVGLFAVGAPLGVGILYDGFGTYDPVLWIVLGITMLSILPMFMVGSLTTPEPTVPEAV